MVGAVKHVPLFPVVALVLAACSGTSGVGLLGDAAVDARTIDASTLNDAPADASAPPDAPADASAPPDAPADASAPPDAVSDAPGDGGKSDAPACKLTAAYSTKDQDCNLCAEAYCCAQVNACFASKDCNDGYVNCVIACALTEKDKAGYDKCAAICATDYPTGDKLFAGLNLCVDTACKTECAN